VQHAERAVAVLDLVGQHAEGEDVGDLLERHVPLGHLLPDRVRVLLPAPHLGLDSGGGERLLDVERDRVDLPVLRAPDLLEPPGDRRVGLGLELLEREQLHLAHVLVHPHPLGERGVDVHRLAGDALALLGALDEVQRAHVVQPVGELDQQHADVLAHRQQELAQVLGDALVVGQLLDLGQLGDPVDELGDVGAEHLLDFIDRRQRVLDGVVEQRGDDRLLVELEVGHQPGDLDRVAEVRVAAGALLRAVLLHREHVGAVEQRLVGVGVVGLDPFHKFVLAQH
jgi:hypothetical protein